MVGEASGVEQGLAVGGVPGAPLCLTQGDEQFAAPGLTIRSSSGVEKLERLAVVRRCLVVRELVEGPVTGPGRVFDRLVDVASPGEVVGELVDVDVEVGGMDRLDGRPGGLVRRPQFSSVRCILRGSRAAFRN